MKAIHWALGGAAVVGAYLLWKRSAAAAPQVAARAAEPILTDPKSSGQYQAQYGGSSDGVDIYDVRRVGSTTVILTYSQRGTDPATRSLVAAPGDIQAEIANLIKLYSIKIPPVSGWR